MESVLICGAFSGRRRLQMGQATRGGYIVFISPCEMGNISINLKIQ